MILNDPVWFAAAPALLAVAAVGFRFRGDTDGLPLGHRLLRRGRMPRTVHRAIQREGIRHLEEDLRIGVTFRGRRGTSAAGRRQIHTGAVAVTSRRLVAHLSAQRVLNLPFDHDGFARLRARREGADGVCLEVDASALNDRTSGTFEYRFRTIAADRLTRMLREATADPLDRWRQTDTTSEFV